MIKLEKISKTFESPTGSVEAVRDVTLNINRGEIFGIIGLSGAGKSTLVRCINLLERPDGGSVTVDGVELTTLDERALRARRANMGMVFQHFNLMPSRRVGENIAYPLKKAGLPKGEIAARVEELLALVGLEDKRDSWPSSLSGGQKQRVAIARAIATRPAVLLCDEATSALDPATTLSILDLLGRINRELGITIVLITHEMAVVKEICHRVAVMEKGRIVEQGPVAQVFSAPSSPVTRSLVDVQTGADRAARLLEGEQPHLTLAPGQVLARLKYLGRSADMALISQASRDFHVDCNIIFGNMDVVAGTTIGTLVLVLSGEKEKIINAVDFFSRNNVLVEVIKR